MTSHPAELRWLTAPQQEQVEATIAEVEATTSAEIRVVVLQYCWQPLLRKAQQIFEKYQLHKTKQRNAVMILLVLKNREMLLYGDQGIHEKVTPEFWVQVKDAMVARMAAGELIEGICVGIRQIGERLQHFFPATGDGINELPNEVIHED